MSPPEGANTPLREQVYYNNVFITRRCRYEHFWCGSVSTTPPCSSSGDAARTPSFWTKEATDIVLNMMMCCMYDTCSKKSNYHAHNIQIKTHNRKLHNTIYTCSITLSIISMTAIYQFTKQSNSEVCNRCLTALLIYHLKPIRCYLNSLYKLNNDTLQLNLLWQKDEKEMDTSRQPYLVFLVSGEGNVKLL